jgi:hypothetical protein
MSNFSYLCNFPVGLPILELNNSSEISNLDLEAARTFRNWAQSQGNPQYNIWDDDYIGTMWPVGMSLEDAMYYYWNSAGMSFSGMSGEFFNSDEEILYKEIGSSVVYPVTSFRNVFTNYDCPPDEYNAKNFGDQYYALKLANAPSFLDVENPCLTAQSIFNNVEEYNYNTCNYSINDISFAELSFTAFLFFLNRTTYGGSGTIEDLRQKYPPIIKINDLYYPAIHISFRWIPAEEVDGDDIIYGEFNAKTYHVLRNQEYTTICEDTSGGGDDFSYDAVFREQYLGPYDLQLSGFPSGTTYNIPIYNIYLCSGDLYNECPEEGFNCESTPINIELGTLELIPRE